MTGFAGTPLRESSRAAPHEVEMHVVSIAEALEPDRPTAWSDPEGIAALTPEKLRAIVANPFSSGRDDPAQIIGTVGDRVAGRIDVLPGRLKVGDRKVSCVVASGLYVAPEYRELGMGAMLLLRLQQLHHTVAACGVSKQAFPMYVKLRWLNLPMRRHVLVRRSRPLLERYAPGRAVAAAGSVLGDSALGAYRALSAGPRAIALRGLSCERVEGLTDAMDDVLGGVEEPAAFHRTAAWVNWILRSSFESHPRNDRGLFLVRDRAGVVVAYFLITARFHEKASRRELPNLLLGSLQDWMILDRTALDVQQVILLATRELAKWRVAAVEVCLGEADEVPQLWRWGFRRVGDLHLLVKASPGSPLRASSFSLASAWRVRPADGDNAL